MSIAGVVLAAGASTRLGEPKQLLADASGEVLVHRAARMLLETRCAPVFVIVGSDSTAVRNALADFDARSLPDASMHSDRTGEAAVYCVDNERWREGIASSIRAAVHAAVPFEEVDALLLITCDMPAVDTGHLRALSTTLLSGAVRVASRYATRDGETVGTPAIVRRDEWERLEDLQGDRGAKSLLDDEATVTLPLAGGAFDIDTPEDVARWRSSGMSTPQVGERAPRKDGRDRQ